MAKNLPHTSPNAARQAREQAEAYDSIFADTELTLTDGSTIKIPPHPDLGMLDDERIEAYEELLMEVESYDREDDIYIPEQRLKDPETGRETGVVLPADTQRGVLKRPYRKNGELLKPPHSVRVVQVVLGEDEYKRLRDGGFSARDVWRIWGQQGLDLRQRQDGDSKSNGGPVGLASISAANS